MTNFRFSSLKKGTISANLEKLFTHKDVDRVCSISVDKIVLSLL